MLFSEPVVNKMTNSNVRGVCVVWWEQRVLYKFCVWAGSKCLSCFCVRCDSPLCGALSIMNIQSSKARCLLFLILWGTLLLASVKWKWLEGVRQQPGKCKLTIYKRGHCRTWRAPAQVCQCEGLRINSWYQVGKQDGEQCSRHQIICAFRTQNCILPLRKLGV